ncbi:MAG: hypothetical protein WAQ98_32485 [Blastocatellia bacterium]
MYICRIRLKTLLISLSIFLFIFSVSFTSFSQKSNKTSKNALVLPYQKFGPQVVAYPLIGFEYYQWNSHGSSDPKQQDDINVVVYKDIDLELVKKQYPVIKDKSDYRYVEFTEAIKFIDDKIDEWKEDKAKETDKEFILTYDKLINNYLILRKAIVKKLGQKSVVKSN